MTFDLLILLPFGCFVLITWVIFSIWKKTQGSDEFYHRYLVEMIRENDNNFIHTHSSLLGNIPIQYPQLLHWIIARFNVKDIDWFGNVVYFLSLFLSLISGITLFYFTNESLFPLSIGELSLALAIYLTIPYNFLSWNSKNSGFSSRGIGLTLGKVYLYSLIVFTVSGNYGVLVVALIALIPIIFSSQFAMQYVLLISILWSMFFMLWQPIAILFLACMISYLIGGKVFRNFLIGQFNHKYLYATHLARVYILKSRFSIWRDLVYDIPLMIFKALRRKRPKQLFNNYIWWNPVISMLVNIPALTILLIHWWIEGLGDDTMAFAFNVIIIHLIIFFVTSLRPTRFLGEPDRYMEFCFWIISLACAYMLPVLLIPLMLFQVILVLTRVLNLRNTSFNKSTFEPLKSLRRKLIKENTTFICNHTNYSKYFFSPHIKQFLYWPVVKSIHGKPFRFFYPEDYRFISTESMIWAIDEFNISNCLIVETDIKEYQYLLEERQFVIDREFTINRDNFRFYCRKISSQDELRYD